MSKMTQEKMLHLVKGNKLPNKTPTDQQATDDYRQLFFQNYEFIKRQCYKICGKNRGVSSLPQGTEHFLDFGNQTIHVDSINQIDPETFFNQVLDHLTAYDYKVLREFKNRSKITTYLTTIISRLFIDIQRKHKGRSRAKEWARKIGPVGEKLYKLVFEKGYSVDEAYEYLRTPESITESFDEIQMMVEKMRGRQTSGLPQMPIMGNDPEQDLVTKQREELIKKVFNETLSELSNEEKLLIRMRFPLSDDEEPKSLLEIGRMLHTTEKAVDSRIRRILAKLKEKMLRHGLSINDFLDAYA